MAIDLTTLQPTATALPGGYGQAPSQDAAEAMLTPPAAVPMPVAATASPPGPPGPWAPPILPRGVELTAALQRAYTQAASYINQLVAPQGVAVSVAWRDESAPVGQMVNLQDNQVVREYQPWQLLKVYAAGPGGKGFIVDGTV